MRSPKLTTGMATYDDYDGVYFTVQAIRLYHPEVTDLTEIIVLDNDPDGPAAPALRQLGNWVKGLRYEPDQSVQGTASRSLMFQKARAPNVLVMDSHVICVPGSLRRLIDFFCASPGSPDLLQGPLLHDDARSVSTHFAPSWGQGMFGQWDTDDRGVDPDAPPSRYRCRG